MTTSLVVCGGCGRHVRASEARCPFCAAAVRVEEPPPAALPPGASRAFIAALGVSLSLGACQGGATTAGPRTASDATRATQTEAHPTIAPPYGAPPDPQWAELPPAVRSLTWRVTLSNTIPMGARATTALVISATNASSAPVRPERERLRLRVNGEPSTAFDLAFNNGVAGAGWAELAPGRTARDERPVLEALLPAPGEYLLVLEWDGRRVAARSVTVTP